MTKYIFLALKSAACLTGESWEEDRYPLCIIKHCAKRYKVSEMKQD